MTRHDTTIGIDIIGAHQPVCRCSCHLVNPVNLVILVILVDRHMFQSPGSPED